MGAPKKERLSLGAMAHIPILCLNSNLAMFLMVPRRAKWKHLWLECRGVLDLKFEDVTTFAQVTLLAAHGYTWPCSACIAAINSLRKGRAVMTVYCGADF